MENLFLDLKTLVDGCIEAAGHGHLALLLFALLAACAFEFVNGFHDTANAVATVIYTRSLKPWTAVIWSGICNFAGVLLGGTVVAMAIVKLLPAEVLAQTDTVSSLSVVFALLFGAIIWNVGTWYFGLPASSSHTLIGSILGIGLAHSWIKNGSALKGIDWSKAADVGLALLFSPLIGFTVAGGLLLLSKKLFKNPALHTDPNPAAPPPWSVRMTLIGTSTGVSLAHGSNDGQKGVGLIMLILITILPGQFALRPDIKGSELQHIQLVAQQATEAVTTVTQGHSLLPEQVYAPDADESLILTAAHAKTPELSLHPIEFKLLTQIGLQLDQLVSAIKGKNLQVLSTSEKMQLRGQIYGLEKSIKKLEKLKSPVTLLPEWKRISEVKKVALKATDYAPYWVLLIVALSLGIGTMVGWKRIVVTIGENIGKSHLTYAQGAAAELVAMSTIGLSALLGVPVSTTHVLSSGVAGTMVASRTGVHGGVIKKILLAWVMTLPATVFLSSGLYLLFHWMMRG